MEDTVNDNLPAGEQDANAAIAGAQNPEGEQQNQQPDNESIALSVLREKGFEVNSFDDLKKVPEKVIETKEVDRYEGLLDDEDRRYLEFKKETGRSRKDFEALNVDYDQADKLQLARERVRRDHGMPDLSNEAADEWLASKLGILDMNDLTTSDKIELSGFAKPVIDQYKAEQEKYRKPAEQNQQPKNEPAQEELVQLPNGATMRKADYDKAVADHQKQIEEAKEAVKKVLPASFKLKVDDEGNERVMEYSFDYGQEEFDGMSSIVSDVQGTLNKRYETENGFNHAAFAEDMLWSDPKFRENAIPKMLSKARAEGIEEVMKSIGNHNYQRNTPLPKQVKEGVRYVPIGEIAKLI